MSSGAQPNWIQYEFDEVYKLRRAAGVELQPDRSRRSSASAPRTSRSSTPSTARHGRRWPACRNSPRRRGSTGYTANTTVDFGGVMAKFVKLTINSNWGGVAPQTGLSEVRFFYVPVQAREPAAGDRSHGRRRRHRSELAARPRGDLAQGVPRHRSGRRGRWLRAGRDGDRAQLHPGSLWTSATTYYWKVDEVGGAGPYAGDVWSFTTQEYRGDRRLRELQRRRQPHLRYLDRRPDQQGQRLAGRIRCLAVCREDDHSRRQAVHASEVRQLGLAVCLGGRADLRLAPELDHQRGRHPVAVLPGQHAGLRGDGLRQHSHERHRHGHLGQRPTSSAMPTRPSTATARWSPASRASSTATSGPRAAS